MQPKITVIIPAYNVENYIQRCLDSVLNSTYQNIEVIAIDDGSTDNTGRILDLYQGDPRVVVIHQENQGLVAVREEGIRRAVGEYIGFVDGDDAVEPDMYERLLQNALVHNADISHCGLCVFWSEEVTEPHYGSGKILIQDSTMAQIDLLEGHLFDASLCNKLYKKDLMRDSCLDKTLQSNEDLLRNFTLFRRASCVVFEDFCGYQYWSRKNSMSNDSKVEQRNRQIIKVRRLILENASAEVRPYAKRKLLSTYVGVINQNVQRGDSLLQELAGECRKELKREKKNIPCLILRQQIAAYLILYVPWLHRLAYKIYDSRR